MRSAEFIAERGISTTLCTTSQMAFFGVPTEPRLSSLRRVVETGEALPAAVAELWVEAGIPVVNACGPTEALAFTVAGPYKSLPVRVTIGVPYANCRAYIVDPVTMRRVGVCVPGELLVAGTQVGRGYLGRLERTAKVFIRNPFPSANEEPAMSPRQACQQPATNE